ncbi:hypothetical protein [uncultured Aquimarina sp.]|uniref:hypothetical protein n=1 Tax=uncultured Aquimarina sp. TaxID=575652 RepID=UPI0026138C81|nr:hypothetical protein [uncultured Aquimarina sp.]
MKNLRIFSLLMFGLMIAFSSCEQEDDNQNTECPQLSFGQDGKKLVADFEGIEDLDTYEWFVDGELVETESQQNERDNTLDLSSYNPGTYNVCIKVETPDCPEGTEFCREITIEEEMDGCPDLKFTRDGEYLFADFEGIDTLEFYAWKVTGENLENGEIIENEGTSNQGDNKFSLENLEEGTYTVCLISESPTCTSTEYCEEITIEGDGDGQGSCPDLTLSSEGSIVVASISGTDDIESFNWFVNNEPLAAEDLQIQGTTITLDLSDYNPGSYEVCVKFESNDCAQGIEACVSAQVTDDNNGGGDDGCPDLSFIEEGPFMFASFAGIDQLAVYEWFVDGVLVETEDLQSQDRDDKLDLSSYNPGTYRVCIKAETNDCPNGTEFCRDVVIPEPQPVDCTIFKLEYVTTNSAEFVNAKGVILFGLDDNSVVWEIDGNQVTPTTATGHFLILQDHLQQPGRYEICYKAESSECGSLQECVEIDFQGL